MRIFKLFYEIFKDVADDYVDQAKHRATKIARKIYLYAIASFVNCLILGLSLFALVEKIGLMIDHPGGFFWTGSMTWFLFVSIVSGSVLYLVSCRGHRRHRSHIMYEEFYEPYTEPDLEVKLRRKNYGKKRRKTTRRKPQ